MTDSGLKRAAVLCILRHEDHLLLLRRTKKLHYGKYIPVGGHVDPHESFRHAAIREIYEETGLHVDDVRLCGTLAETSPTDFNWINYIYTADVARIEPPPCNEGVLEWVPVSRLADLPTPATDLFIYHLVLENRFFALQAEYDAAIDLLLLQDEITGQVLFRHL